MRKPKIYLDTSVISHLDAPETPEKMADTLKLWGKIQEGKYEVVLSEVFFEELDRCQEPKRSRLAAAVRQIKHERIGPSDEMDALASKFVELGILSQKSIDDCLHMAAALLSGCDVIVSWNFKHIVNTKTTKGARAIATLGGYKDIMIFSPTTLVEEADNE